MDAIAGKPGSHMGFKVCLRAGYTPSNDNMIKVANNTCGSWLACDAGTSVFQPYRVDAIAGKPGSHMGFKVCLRAGYTPSNDNMIKVANNTKCVIPSMALVSPSLRLIALTTSVINTITVCTGVIAIWNGWPV